MYKHRPAVAAGVTVEAFTPVSKSRPLRSTLEAQNSLGVMYALREGVSAADRCPQPVAWYLISADQGSLLTQKLGSNKCTLSKKFLQQQATPGSDDDAAVVSWSRKPPSANGGS